MSSAPWKSRYLCRPSHLRRGDRFCPRLGRRYRDADGRRVRPPLPQGLAAGDRRSPARGRQAGCSGGTGHHVRRRQPSSGGRILVTAGAAPVRIPGILAALASRLAAGPRPSRWCRQARPRACVPVERLAALRGLALPADVAELLAAETAATVPELAALLAQFELAVSPGGSPRSGRRCAPRAGRYPLRRRVPAAVRDRRRHRASLWSPPRRPPQRLAPPYRGHRPRRGHVPRPLTSPARASHASATTSAAAIIPPSRTVAAKLNSCLRPTLTSAMRSSSCRSAVWYRPHVQNLFGRLSRRIRFFVPVNSRLCAALKRCRRRTPARARPVVRRATGFPGRWPRAQAPPL